MTSDFLKEKRVIKLMTFSRISQFDRIREKK